jgi:hypothetical protein
MPSFCKHALKGIKKVHAPSSPSYVKTFFYGMKKAVCSIPIFSPPPPPLPHSSVFDTFDCIWYYGTLYVRENVAVAKLLEQQQQQQQQQQHIQITEQCQGQFQCTPEGPEDEDDTESVSSGISSGTNVHPRNIGKQNQLKYLKDGMQLRHFFNESDYWYAVFNAETNRIIRTPDGVTFDTLRQFARLHYNEVLGMTPALGNVWTNPNFQYLDADGNWHPLSNLKSGTI